MSWRQLWQQFRRNRAAELSLYLIIGFVLAAALAYRLADQPTEAVRQS